MADVVHAFLESPQYKRGALFIVYDEWGGFFDHVPRRACPTARASADINQDFGRMGIRIPAIADLALRQDAAVDRGIYGFESILKMIGYRFGLPPLTRRDKLRPQHRPRLRLRGQAAPGSARPAAPRAHLCPRRARPRA